MAVLNLSRRTTASLILGRAIRAASGPHRRSVCRINLSIFMSESWEVCGRKDEVLFEGKRLLPQRCPKAGICAVDIRWIGLDVEVMKAEAFKVQWGVYQGFMQEEGVGAPSVLGFPDRTTIPCQYLARIYDADSPAPSLHRFAARCLMRHAFHPLLRPLRVNRRCKPQTFDCILSRSSHAF